MRHLAAGWILALGLAVGVAPATAAAKWTQVTAGKQGNSDVLGLARTADGVLHVAWNVEDTPNLQSIHITPITPAGALGTAADVVTGWAGAGDPALVVEPGGGLRIFFGGIHSTDTADPLVGMISASSGADGAIWTGLVNTDARTDDYGYGRVPGATVAADG